MRNYRKSSKNCNFGCIWGYEKDQKKSLGLPKIEKGNLGDYKTDKVHAISNTFLSAIAIRTTLGKHCPLLGNYMLKFFLHSFIVVRDKQK